MTTLDDVARQLREWRIAAGSPSYAELARRVGELRACDDDPRRRAPGRVTVYDCFRDGRSRIDVDLVIDLAAALGVAGTELTEWRRRCGEAMRPPVRHGAVTASSIAPAPVEPWVDGLPDLGTSTRLLFAGIGGSGKTQAAARVLTDWLSTGTVTGVLSVRLDGPGASTDDLLRAAGHEAGIRLPEDPEPSAARLLDVLSRRGTALFVDDVSNPAQLAPLGAAPGSAPVVATSRLALDVPGFTRVDLAPWSPQQVTDYLEQVVGTARTDREPGPVADLVELTGGLPLVVALVAARVRSTPAWSLADHATALRERRSNDQVDDAVRTSMDASLAALSPSARSLLSLLASGPRSGLTDDALRASSDLDVDAGLAELEQAYLLQRGDHRHRLHDVARGYARQRATDDDPPSVRTERVDALLGRLCSEAWGVARVLGPSDFEASRFERPPVAASSPQAWLSTDLPGALELAGEQARRRPDAVIELSEAVATSLERTGLSGLSEQLHALAREAAVASSDVVGEVRARCALAITAVRRDESGVALDEIALQARRIGDTWALARIDNVRGILAMRAGDDAEGTRRFIEAHATALEAGHLALAPAIAGNVALSLTYAGDLDGALRWNLETLAGAEASGNRSLAATTLSNMSEAQRLLGRHQEAVDSAERSVAHAEAAGDRLACTHALANLGASLTLVGRIDRAIGCLEQAESVSADIGLVEVEATLHTRMGEALVAAGDRARATDRFHSALEAHNDSPIDPATALHQLGLLAVDSDPGLARQRFDSALDLLGEGFDQVAAAIRADRDALA